MIKVRKLGASKYFVLWLKLSEIFKINFPNKYNFHSPIYIFLCEQLNFLATQKRAFSKVKANLSIFYLKSNVSISKINQSKIK